ncbi:ribosome maturation factor RimP [Sulfoacidibacillus thermotolerans]|uniref:Ribosome maturation factor RimP n=1 Tax=Sulfoacidibacillus thermotolerans TaxID=1765684 RepID=A0A2U3DAA4_SULT2|nr:ribosome maturation factor RimP [Sulfoacidibacillus thermotolerans]PWI58216.1 ribosome maturation factor RimP [Sulfoacidibacillus thermotolerans]
MAAKQKVTDLVAEMVAPVLREAGLELVEVEYKKEGANWILRVFLDRPGGAVDLDDCAHVSETLSTALDEVDPIPNAYFLEVSSAGAERPLKTERDFERAVGKRVFLSFYEPLDGKKNIEGTLLSFSDEVLRVEEDGAVFAVPKEKIAAARLALVW